MDKYDASYASLLESWLPGTSDSYCIQILNERLWHQALGAASRMASVKSKNETLLKEFLVHGYIILTRIDRKTSSIGNDLTAYLTALSRQIMTLNSSFEDQHFWSKVTMITSYKSLGADIKVSHSCCNVATDSSIIWRRALKSLTCLALAGMAGFLNLPSSEF